MSANTNQKSTTNDKNSEISVNHQKLIDATIETIAKRGLADTTISHVAKILSPVLLFGCAFIWP